MKKIWSQDFSLEDLNSRLPNTLGGWLGIQFTEIGPDFLKASMPIDHRTVQPMGLLHGGASASLAETIGSVASWMCINLDGGAQPVGLEINANHLKAVLSGNVHAIAKPIRIGKTIHVWNIEIFNEKDEICCVSRLTVMILSKN